ncbi:MAG TPA: alpha-L-arabinofuranosidase [Lachnospiraceae bacterium]|nr:alpha-L-arabinofuranosidase [Lachnospiraceae bacterium]
MREIRLNISENCRVKKQGDLFGIFFEDINHAADGGLYGEMVRNRAFEFDRIDNKSYHSMTAWEEIQRGNSMVQAHVEQWDPRNKNNPHYLVLEILVEGEGAGIRNEGYNTGLFLEEGKEYCFTCYCRVRGEKEKAFEVRIENKDGSVCYGKRTLTAEPGVWTKQECTLKSEGSDSSARLVILMNQVMTLELDTVSLFPADTYKMQKNGLRRDIARMIEELKPRFVRFPGGCLTHIGSLNAKDRNGMYRWKNTVGEVWDRPSRRNSWNYNQTLGVGFYEFFRFCEDIGAQPLPVISAGFDPHFLRAADMDNLQEWIEEALDLIEFANGDVTTKWGNLRASMGHPDSFHMKYLAIGNEEVGDEYYERYEKIQDAVKKVYPDILLINSAGPSAAGSEFEKGWAQAERTEAAFADEHFYQCPEWFIANAHRYDIYKTKAKAFLGEYASHDMTWWNALAEAAFMIGMEKADRLGLACYAPLLNNTDYTNWKTNMLHYDNHRVYGTPSYYVQKLFMNYQGEELVKAQADRILTEEKKAPKLHGGCRFFTENSQVHIKNLVIRNEDTYEEIRGENFCVSGKMKEKKMPDICWDHYTVSFDYQREIGGTPQTLCGEHTMCFEFAARDEKNCLQVVFDGWERTVNLNGMVNGFPCSLGMMQVIMDRDCSYKCVLEVRENKIHLNVDGNVLDHECLSTEPDELYYSAVVDDEDHLIVKLSNVAQEKKLIHITTQQKYKEVKEITMSGYELEWRNSFEEPQKVAPKEVVPDEDKKQELEKRNYVCELPEYALTVLVFSK